MRFDKGTGEELPTISKVAYGFLLLGIVFGLMNFYPPDWLFGAFFKTFDSFYANASTECISIALTVLIIDTLNERRQLSQLKAQLQREMCSADNSFARRAVSELAVRGWLYDGSLRGAHLVGANLAGVNLAGADLARTNLWGANLTGANLVGANLEAARLDEAIYDQATIWPADFDPEAAGAIKQAV